MCDEIGAAEFDARDFDPREVVNRYRKRVPLPTLQKTLKGRYAASRQELVELINDKYADFVSLSSRMQGVEAALKPLRAPLEESNEMTQSLRSRLGQLLSQADDTHASLAKARLRRDALQAYVKYAQLLDKAKVAVEELAQAGSSPQESGDAMREQMVQERVALDLRNIRLNLGSNLGSASETPTEVAKDSAGQDEAAKAEAAPAETPEEWSALLAEAAAFEETFAEGLVGRLRALLRSVAGRSEIPQESTASQQTPWEPTRMEMLAVSHLCRSLVTLGRSGAVYAVFIDAFVSEPLAVAAAACQGDEAPGPASGASPSGAATGRPPPPRPAAAGPRRSAGSADLGIYFAGARRALLAESAPLLSLARRLRPAPDRDAAGSGVGGDGDADEAAALVVPSLRIMANAVVLPVLQHMQQVWPSVFMPAFPDVFAANYNHVACFVADAEALMDPSEKQAFQQCVALTEFRKRWKTQVYAQLRAREAAQKLETAASLDVSASGNGGTGSEVQGRFRLHATGELLALIQRAWGDDWYLDSLFQKFTQLTVELLARYGKSLGSSPPDGAASQSDDGIAWDASAGKWATNSAIHRACRAAADLLAVLDEVACGETEGVPPQALGAVTKTILSRAPGGAQGRPAALVRALLRESISDLRPHTDALGVTAVRQVSAAVAPQFAAIRSIPSFYRMLDKPLPTKASPYVEAALRPIQAAAELARQSGLPGSTAADWASRAIGEAATEFASQATQLLESTRQQEASLRRLTAASRAGAGGEARVSDLDKIQVQLCLDVDTFRSGARALIATVAGVGDKPSDPPGLIALAEAVASVWPVYENHRPSGTASS